MADFRRSTWFALSPMMGSRTERAPPAASGAGEEMSNEMRSGVEWAVEGIVLRCSRWGTVHGQERSDEAW